MTKLPGQSIFSWVAKFPAFRRLLWRVSRKVHRLSRGEMHNNLAGNGETLVQACVIAGAADDPLTIFDIGANRGDWTRLFVDQLPAARLPATRVLAFEPVPATFEQLNKQVAAMEHSDVVKTHPLAFSNAAGKAEMLMLGETSGANTMHFDAQLATGALGRVEVSKVTLDAFCKDQSIDHIHFAKCDAEGHDAHVLAGARGLLEAERIDVFQFEYNHSWVNARCYLKDVFALVENLPYRVARICPEHIEVFDNWHFELERYFEANYLLVHEPALEWFDVRVGTFDASNTYA